MKTKKIFLLFSLITLLFLASCSKGVQKTSAKLSLNLSGITNMSSGIGGGGAILFGKNAAGETFGKNISATEVDIDIPNGSWVFYALMWSNDSTAMNGKVHCGKSINQLNGAATTISLSLTNANCTDAEFSGGKFYIASSLNRFADIFIEECDEVNATTGFSCGKKNQGSALSYRFVFNNYKKTAAGFSIEDDSLASECKTINSSNSPSNIYSFGLPINFPSSGPGTPFIGSIEFFMSSDNCDINDPKGVHRFPLRQGLATSAVSEHRVFVSENSCTPSTPDFISGTQDAKKNKCEMFFGSWNGSACSGTFLPVATRFGASGCTTPTTSNIAIKHQFALPRPVLCRPYINNSSSLGAHPFAGGDGSAMRPYKICTEWQLNQIGERNIDYDTSNYKLLNDLDMNKASNIQGVGVYAPPTCTGTSGIDTYHNLNPLDGHLCGNGVVTGDVGFTGVFDGAGRTISNARITAESMSQLGFVRLLGTRSLNGSSGAIKNINFKNLSVRGFGYVGGVAGEVNGDGTISNIKIEDGEVEATSKYTGGVSGNSQGANFVFEKIAINKFKVRGTDYVGGLVGQNAGILRESMFSGIVTTDQKNGTYYAGGLTGTNEASGFISSSFSEGYIRSHSDYIGGIAAKNFGTMSNIYSTMAISSLRNDAGSIQVGGIAAYSDGTITNCFSDTRKMYVGSSTLTYTGTVTTGGSGSTTFCFSDNNNSSVHTTSSYANLRNVSWLNANFLSVVNAGGAWKVAESNGSIPRLSWEQRECLLNNNLLSVALQVTNLGRGTLLNPVLICNADQFLSMNERNSNEHYRLSDSINLSNWGVTGAVADGISLFNGKFNGDGYALYGLNINIDNVMDNDVGIFKTISSEAVVTNLNLYANRVYTVSDIVNGVGLLSKTNNGEISNVKSLSSSVVASSLVGTLAAENLGVIKDSSLSGSHMVANSNVGGVAGTNNGNILRVHANINIASTGVTTTNRIGAITGVNLGNGFINQAEANGEMNIPSGTLTRIGGLIGENGGTLRNAFVSYMNMNLGVTSTTSSVGGIVGDNSSGIVDKTFFIGKILGTELNTDLTGKVDTDSTTDERTIGPIVGKLNGGSLTSSLSLNDYLVWGPNSLSVSSCNSGTNQIALSGSFNGGSTGVLAHHSSPFLIPFTYASNTISFSNAALLGICPTNGESLSLYSSYRNFDEHGEVASFADLKDVTYMSNKDFNITLDDDARAIGYHLARMYGTAIPLNTPIWTIEEGEDYPRLLQIEH